MHTLQHQQKSTLYNVCLSNAAPGLYVKIHDWKKIGLHAVSKFDLCSQLGSKEHERSWEKKTSNSFIIHLRCTEKQRKEATAARQRKPYGILDRKTTSSGEDSDETQCAFARIQRATQPTRTGDRLGQPNNYDCENCNVLVSPVDIPQCRNGRVYEHTHIALLYARCCVCWFISLGAWCNITHNKKRGVVCLVGKIAPSTDLFVNKRW